MKKLFIAFFLFVANSVYADDMTTNMILTSTVIMSSAAAMDDDDPKANTDFYINDHRVVENTSIDVHSIDKTLLKVKSIKEDFKDDNLIVKYSLNQLDKNNYTVLEKTSLKSFAEPTAYVSLDKVIYENKKAIVYISVLDKSHHEELLKNHNTAMNYLLGIVVVAAVFMLLFVFSL